MLFGELGQSDFKKISPLAEVSDCLGVETWLGHRGISGDNGDSGSPVFPFFFLVNSKENSLVIMILLVIYDFMCNQICTLAIFYAFC